MNVRDIMTPNPLTGAPNWTVRQVLQTMIEHRIRHLPIVEEDGELVGVVSERDLRDELVPPLVGLIFEGSSASEAVLDQSISSVMRQRPITARSNTAIEDVIDVMVSRKIGAVIIVDADGQKPVGIVSYIDVLIAARELFAA